MSVCHHHCAGLHAAARDRHRLRAGLPSRRGRRHQAAVSGISTTSSATPTCWWSSRRRAPRSPARSASTAMVLMRRHGVTVVGTSVRDCVFRCDLLGAQCRVSRCGPWRSAQHRVAVAGRDASCRGEITGKTTGLDALRGNTGRCGSPRPAAVAGGRPTRQSHSKASSAPSAKRAESQTAALIWAFPAGAFGVECGPLGGAQR